MSFATLVSYGMYVRKGTCNYYGLHSANICFDFGNIVMLEAPACGGLIVLRITIVKLASGIILVDMSER